MIFKAPLLLLLALLATACLPAADLTLIGNGKSDYAIVYADGVEHPQLKIYNAATAETLQKLLRASTGAALGIWPESAFKHDRPAIFIGNTAAAKKAGLTPEKWERWEHRINVKERNVYLHGMDFRGTTRPTDRYRTLFVLGSHKAMLSFLEQFAGAVFAGTPKTAEALPKLEKLTIPENFSYQRVPRIEYCFTGRRNIDYDLANNGFYAPWYGTYGGHNHPIAVPTAKYFKSNPEYFAVQRGKRNPGNQNQLCLSNPDVQKLIYQEVLNHLDSGYDMVQLAQSDGFSPCECDQCRDLYGVKPKADPKDRSALRNDPAWGEKLWILHRDIAKKLMKDRPGKKVCVIAYGPTKKPPESFREFPPNVTIELAPYSEEIVESWKGYSVPGGFVVYLYNWGYYKPEGFMPKQSWDFCKEQANSFWKNNVRGIYCCGFGELHGLEGPTYYIWLKLLEDPSRDPQKLLKRFCERVFGDAADEMETFYTMLDDRLKLHYSKKEIDWNDPDLLNGRVPAGRNNIETILLRWPDRELDKLDAQLKRAESKIKEKNWQLALARYEFDFMNATARTVNALARFRKSLSEQDYKAVESFLLQREAFLDAIKWNKHKQAFRDGQPLFGYAPPATVKAGGRLSAPLYAPFQWNIKWMAEKGIQPAGRTIKAGDRQGQWMVPGNFMTGEEENYVKQAVRVFCYPTEDALKVVFIRENSDYEKVKNSELSVMLGADRKGLLWFPARFRNGHSAMYTFEKSNAENQGLGDVYKMTGKTGGQVTVPAPGVALAPGEVSAELSIPWTLFGRKPAPGEKWLFNATANLNGIYCIWEHNFDQATWRNTRDRLGTLTF